MLLSFKSFPDIISFFGCYTMTEIPTLPSYQSVESALKKAGANFNASQVHGLFCGLICATSGEQKENVWKKLLFGKEGKTNGLETFEHLYEMSYHLLSEFSFEFSLLLPTDSKSISVRTEELGLWCQGFLSGLEKFHTVILARATEDVREALNDIIEIAQVNFDNLTDSDDDENAYFELVEYVRLSVLMIFQDLRSNHKVDEQNLQ
jgi:uncharacterized protein YgfB (UPF0149 family)